MPTLSIQLPGFPAVSHVLKDETTTIGRFKGNTIVIEDASVSLMHAKITRKDGQFFLKDLNSTNGTIVNGQPIGEVRLRDQDRVRFAEITTQFLADGEVPLTGSSPTAVAPVAGPVSAPPARTQALPAPIAAATPAPAAAPARVASIPKPTPTAPRRRKLPVRALAIAASVLILALAGGAMVVWKFAGSAAKNSEIASMPKSLVSKKASTTEAVTQVVPNKPSVEAKPVSEPNESVAPPTLNMAETIAALKSKDVAERRRAASALHGAGLDAKEAVPALKEALKDSDQEVQMWAALTLVNTQSYDRAVIPILVRSLKNENTVLRQVACLSLGLIPYEAGDKQSVIPALSETASKDGDEDVRQAAKAALNIVGTESPESLSAK